MRKLSVLFALLVGLVFSASAIAQGVVWEMIPDAPTGSTQEYPYGSALPVDAVCLVINYTVISMSDEFEPYVQVGNDRYSLELSQVTPDPGFYTQELRLSNFALKDPDTGDLDLTNLYSPSEGSNGAGVHGWDAQNDAHIILHSFTPLEECGTTVAGVAPSVTATDWVTLNHGTPRVLEGVNYIDFDSDVDIRGLRISLMMFDDVTEWIVDASIDGFYVDFVRIRIDEDSVLRPDWQEYGWSLHFLR